MRPETLSRNQIMEMENMEMCRIAIDRYGVDNFLSQLERGDIVDERMDPISGINEMLVFLYAAEVPAPSPYYLGEMMWQNIYALVCFCPSTARRYLIQVPSDTKTCDEAQQWLKGDRMTQARIIGAS